MYDRILFPTDGSEGAEVAIEHAIALAELAGIPVHLLYVVDTTAARGTDAYAGISLDRLNAAGDEHLDAVREQFESAAIDVTTEVVEGTPSTSIVEAATDGDLVVMGTHGRTGLDRYLIGSTTEKVVRTADVPVVTVPVTDLDDG